MMVQIFTLKLVVRLLEELFHLELQLLQLQEDMIVQHPATHSNGATVELYQLNGIPLTQVNKTHTAIANNRIDSYTVATTTVLLKF